MNSAARSCAPPAPVNQAASPPGGALASAVSIRGAGSSIGRCLKPPWKTGTEFSAAVASPAPCRRASAVRSSSPASDRARPCRAPPGPSAPTVTTRSAGRSSLVTAAPSMWMTPSPLRSSLMERAEARRLGRGARGGSDRSAPPASPCPRTPKLAEPGLRSFASGVWEVNRQPCGECCGLHELERHSVTLADGVVLGVVETGIGRLAAQARTGAPAAGSRRRTDDHGRPSDWR